MPDNLSSRRTRLGMTIQPKKSTPYDELGAKTLKGLKEQTNLEEQGARIIQGRKRQAAKGQNRIPKATPGGRTGRSRT